MPTAILFPGQGSQQPEMREAVLRTRPELVEMAVAAVGEDPFPRADEDTRFAQPAILAASLAAYSTLAAADAVAVAGHSLGELTALAAAGVLSEADALHLAALRGQLMSESGRRRGDGTMLAALGGDADAVAAIAADHGVTVANDNAPGQLVLSGERADLRAAGEDLKAAGVRTLELNVAGAFHSPFMADAVPEFEAALADTALATATLTVYSSVTAAPLDDVRARLAEALTAPVRWRETVLALDAAGIDDYIDAGPGQVLAKLLKRILRQAARA